MILSGVLTDCKVLPLCPGCPPLGLSLGLRNDFVYVCTLSCHSSAMIGIFCEMTKCGFTSINGDFAFARNAKWALVDDCLLEGVIWLRKYAEPTGILIGLKFDICRLHIHKTIHTNRFNNYLVLVQNQVYVLLTSSVDYFMLWGC